MKSRMLFVWAVFSALVLMSASNLYAGVNTEPPPGAKLIQSPKITGTIIVTFVGDAVRNETTGEVIDELTMGVVTSSVVAKCRGKAFVLGPGIMGGDMSLAEFKQRLSKAGIVDEGIGPLAPEGCFSTAGGEWLDIDGVVQYRVRSVQEMIEPVLNMDEVEALVVVDVSIGGYE